MKTLYLADLDGTLIRSNEQISIYTANTINKFIGDGGCFSYATGRSFVTASKVTYGLRMEFPSVCYNGAFIVGSKSKENLLANYFSLNDAEDVRHLLTEYKLSPIVYAYINGTERFSFIDCSGGFGMRFFLNSRLGDARRREVLREEDLYHGDIFCFTCISDEKSLTPIHNIFKSDKRVHCVYQKDVYSGAQFFELLPEKATKANAALQLKAMLGCDKIVAFGDSYNDISLFSAADESYAVANAVPELKTIATGVIASNDNDGVARWIEENLYGSNTR